MFKQTTTKSLKVRLSLLVTSAVFVTVGILVILGAFNLKRQALLTARQEARMTAESYSYLIQNSLENNLQVSKLLAQQLGAVLSPKDSVKLDRQDVIGILRYILESNQELTCTYTLWEPNAFDGMDMNYVQKDEAHDETGRLVPNWSRVGNNLVLEPLVYYQDAGLGDYYLIPKKEKREIIYGPSLYPVNGVDVMLVSLISPIIYQDEFYGIAGVDVTISWLQDLVANVSTDFSGTELSIIAYNGTIAGATGKPELIGQDMASLFEENASQQRRLLTSKKAGILENDHELRFCTPLQIGQTNTPWQVCVRLPRNEILAPVTRQIYLEASIGLLLVSTAMLLVYWLLSRSLAPLALLVAKAEDFSKGIISEVNTYNKNNEIGQITSAFNQLASYLKRVASFAGEIGSNKLDTHFQTASQEDAIGKSLLQMRENLQEIRAQESLQLWKNQGIVKLGELQRTYNQDLKELCYKTLVHIIQYLRLNQGGLFLVEEEAEGKPLLRLKAAYAYNRKKFLKKEVLPGEGLVGECFLEKSPTYLQKIPDNYLRITSGLGGANPNFVLVIPLINYEKVLGVLELASFQAISDFEKQFVEEMGSMLAATIANLKVNEETRHLLRASQKMEQELRAQEEELRQNQEEMQATQEEMNRNLKQLKTENEHLQEKLSKYTD